MALLRSAGGVASHRKIFIRSLQRKGIASFATTSLLDRYMALTQHDDEEGGLTIRKDPLQLQTLQVLEDLRSRLVNQQSVSTATDSPSWMQPLVSSSSKSHPRGIYLHGGPGCGKTFLMNLFYDSLPPSMSKQKVHFHSFMLDAHQTMHQARQEESSSSDRILPALTAATLEKGRLLCFDEFQVTDVADAMILQRLFTGLWDAGAVVVATSNRPPDCLYKNGLQRDRFLPFIALLKEHCTVLSMEDATIDYRQVQKEEMSPSASSEEEDEGRVFFVGGKAARKKWKRRFEAIAGPQTAVAPTQLRTQGRKVAIPLAARSVGLARFDFYQLCGQALGAADYLVIGKHFRTVCVENIPVLSVNELNWVRRFITFVDSMYESRVRLILHSHKPLETTFVRADSEANYDEVFAWDRTLSRLQEMSGGPYLQAIAKERPTLRDNAEANSDTVTLSSVNLLPSLGDHVPDFDNK